MPNAARMANVPTPANRLFLRPSAVFFLHPNASGTPCRDLPRECFPYRRGTAARPGRGVGKHFAAVFIFCCNNGGCITFVFSDFQKALVVFTDRLSEFQAINRAHAFSHPRFGFVGASRKKSGGRN